MAKLIEKIDGLTPKQWNTALSSLELKALTLPRTLCEPQKARQCLERLIKELNQDTQAFRYYESQLRASLNSAKCAECDYYMQAYSCLWYAHKQLLVAYIKLSVGGMNEDDFFEAQCTPLDELCSQTEDGRQQLIRRKGARKTFHSMLTNDLS